MGIYKSCLKIGCKNVKQIPPACFYTCNKRKEKLLEVRDLMGYDEVPGYCVNKKKVGDELIWQTLSTASD